MKDKLLRDQLSTLITVVGAVVAAAFVVYVDGAVEPSQTVEALGDAAAAVAGALFIRAVQKK